MPVDTDAVADLMLEVSQAVVLPRHRRLLTGDIEEKSPGDVVTVADREAEALLAAGLTRLLPDVPVVGEEAAFLDPALERLPAQAPRVWLVDPVDGTSSFAAGSDDFAMMVALVEDGHAVAAWIHQPVSGVTYRAELGAGAFRDACRLTSGRDVPDLHRLRGKALTRFMPEYQRRIVELAAADLPHVGRGPVAAGIEYPRIADGAADFALFWRTLPWDHAPGALLVTEAGGVAKHLDGSAYEVGRPRPGLLVAGNEQTWSAVRRAFHELDDSGTIAAS